MNNTHYVILNADNQPVFAVLKSENVIDRIYNGIAEETGEGRPESISDIDFEKLDFTGTQFEATMKDDGTWTYYIFPLWIY